MFGLWYPGPFRALAGGRDLFLLVTSVDVVLGPVLTFAVFNRAKPRRELRRDLAIIGLLQLAGLAYGLNTVYAARPVAMVFEVDRLRLVTAVDVAVEELPKALPQYRELPITGPWLLAARAPKGIEEHNDALFKGLAGSDISSRPGFCNLRGVDRRHLGQVAARYARSARSPSRQGRRDATVAARDEGRPGDGPVPARAGTRILVCRAG